MTTRTAPGTLTPARAPLGASHVRIALGSALLLHPPRRADRPARILGWRYVAQGAVGLFLAKSSPARVSHTNAAIEVVHGASMIGLALVSARYRQLALVGGAIAATLVVTDLRGVHG